MLGIYTLHITLFLSASQVGGTELFQDVHKYSPTETVQHSRRHGLSPTMPWELQISQLRTALNKTRNCIRSTKHTVF